MRKDGIASGKVLAHSGTNGWPPDYAAVKMDGNGSVVCAYIATDVDYDISVGATVLVSYEDDNSQRIVAPYRRTAWHIATWLQRPINPIYWRIRYAIESNRSPSQADIPFTDFC